MQAFNEMSYGNEFLGCFIVLEYNWTIVVLI